MDARDLTREQLEALGASVGKHLRYYGRLRARMDRIGWRPKDVIRQQVEQAWEAVYGLSVHLHYATCPEQTGGHPGTMPADDGGPG